MNKRNLKRQKLPDLDKVIQLGITRLCKEYEKLSAKDDLTATDVKTLWQLTKTLMDFKSDPGIRDMMRAQKIKLEPTTEELMDILHGRLPADILSEEDAENDEGRQAS